MIESNEHHLPMPGAAKTSQAWKWFETFRRAQIQGLEYDVSQSSNNAYNNHRAAVQTANTALVRRLKSRHLQMIAIGGSIGTWSLRVYTPSHRSTPGALLTIVFTGTGLWIGTGKVMVVGGPGSVFFAFVAIGTVLYFTMQAMGELVSLHKFFFLQYAVRLAS